MSEGGIEYEEYTGYTKIDYSRSENKVYLNKKYVMFSNFRISIHQHGIDLRTEKERYILDCVGLDQDFRFHVPIFPIDLRTFEEFNKILLHYADKHAVIKVNVMKNANFHDHVYSLVYEYQKNKDRQEEVAIINDLGFFSFGKNKTMFFAVNTKQLIYCEKNKENQGEEEVPMFEVFYFGKPLRSNYIYNEQGNPREKLLNLMNLIEMATPENYPNFLATLSAILCSLNRKELYANNLKMGPLHYLGPRETGKSQMRMFVQALLPHIATDGVCKPDVTNNITLTVATQRAQENMHPFFMDPSPDMNEYASFLDSQYEGNQVMNLRNQERTGRLAPSQVFIVWDHEKRSLQNFKVTLKTKGEKL